MGKLATGVRLVSLLVGVLYPVMVFFGLEHFSVTICALILLAVVALRVLASILDDGFDLMRVAGVLGLAGVVALWSVWGNDELGLLLVPAFINLGLLGVFANSLRSVPIIERFARRFDPDLTGAKQRHCRDFTLAWCAFFMGNGAICAALALLTPRAWWATYTGGIAYALMGAMFALEFLVRRYRFGEYTDYLHDQWLRAILPSHSSNADA